ncbi:TraB/GumN family protein [Flavisolibacter nicotianae]|uniref:TraB/GumN family protein n=1 Tax=Flavisolibacter nicotianae TaxID=2364882 RepID=UPI000EB58DE3|nr:TraB/GumN family protein [Flavisolibacter nicotianae]
MKCLLCACAVFLGLTPSFSQTKIKAEKYPSLLWEISGKGQKPSYLFGTMHVSSKMVFHLSDSFYYAIRHADVVALETNPGTWQENFSRYDLEGEGLNAMMGRYRSAAGGETTPRDYLTINSLKLASFEKAVEAALYSSPSLLNSFLYRSNSESSGDFEEDTYLDLHIFQTGRKLGKKVCGVEDFDGSMQLVKEAYADAAKEKKKSRSYDYDDNFSYARMEEAYRTGNLDLLDTINKVNSQSAAFDEKFLYRRNEIQAASIDSILRSGTPLFVGVGAAHLPGSRGVIELLRKKGYLLRPIRMQEQDSRHKESLESLKVPVQFSRQTAEDGFYSVAVPGKLFSFGRGSSGFDMKQHADMVNGSYYLVTRVMTNAAIMGQSEADVLRKLDSVLYENIPGKILSKRPVVKNGYRGFDILNRTRRGDVQRYNIFITPFELLVFKMSGNGNYVSRGTEAERFFGSIQLNETKTAWKKWQPASGGFEVDMPQAPLVYKGGDWLCAGYDAESKTAVEVIRTDIHNHDFLEEDSFDLDLMEESFAASENIGRNLSRQRISVNGYPALEARYRCKDSTVTVARFLIQGPHYYTLVSNAKKENRLMQRFFNSFAIRPFVYGESKLEHDTLLRFSVKTPVLLEKKNKLRMYPEEAYFGSSDDDDSLVDNGTYNSLLVAGDSTGEKIAVSLYKPSAYVSRPEKKDRQDSAAFRKQWVMRWQKRDTLSGGMVVYEYELGGRNSSRMLKGKIFARGGSGYRLQTELDTLSARSSFIADFFRTFQPEDLLQDADLKKKKSGFFFSQLFSPDSSLHKKAIKNISSVVFDSTDFPALRQGIRNLSWKEKNYLDVKKDFINGLSGIAIKDASDFLKEVYVAAGDTLELQYAALDALLAQKTAYSFATFAQLVQGDPPVLGTNRNSSSDPGDNFFFDRLSDSLSLSAGIIKDLLPLLNLDDYEQPVLRLMGLLVDSNLLAPQAYASYLPRFLLEAKQALKKQAIQEKTRAIEKARQDEKEGDSDDDSRPQLDPGNPELVRYAALLLPFWDAEPQVATMLGQLGKSNDVQLRFEIAMLLLRNNRPVPGSVLNEFAALDQYRYLLLEALQELDKPALFPARYKNQLDLSRSLLLNLEAYNRPDTLVFLTKKHICASEQEGEVYVFKYKEKKSENAWKLATVGLLPSDSTQFTFSSVVEAGEKDIDYGFTQLTGTKLAVGTSEEEQVQKLLKKRLYSRRKSAAKFYEEDESSGEGIAFRERTDR